MNSSEIAAKVLNDLHESAMAVPPTERAGYIECTLCLCVSLMRGAGNDQYVRDFLEAAIADLDKPSVAFVKPTLQ